MTSAPLRLTIAQAPTTGPTTLLSEQEHADEVFITSSLHHFITSSLHHFSAASGFFGWFTSRRVLDGSGGRGVLWRQMEACRGRCYLRGTLAARLHGCRTDGGVWRLLNAARHSLASDLESRCS